MNLCVIAHNKVTAGSGSETSHIKTKEPIVKNSSTERSTMHQRYTQLSTVKVDNTL